MSSCKICNSATTPFYSTQMLQKYDAAYYRCDTCGFIQTSEPVWLEEAYSKAITSLDIGLISRNLELKDKVARIIDQLFPESRLMLDYGGGYGMFVRMMRDMGYDFYRQDLYCENTFANYFDLSDAPAKRFDLLSTFEVFEHLPDPLAEIQKMFELSATIIFTTVLSPADPEAFKTWWYVSPLTGQHIAFYNLQTLNFIAQKFNKKLYSNGINLHVLTDKTFSKEQVDAALGTQPASLWSRLQGILSSEPAIGRSSLLQEDYAFIEKKLRDQH